jgi:peptidoglycan/xylan/chitin deacetylase (PgdA/CDA1 family)
VIEIDRVKLALAAAVVAVFAAPAGASKPHPSQVAVALPAQDGEVPPGATSRPYPHAWPQPAAGPSRSGDPELIFTFDDGPNPRTTPAVLDALAAHHIHAVFFMVGRRVDKKYGPRLIARIEREGHIIGNHTMTHEDLCKADSDAIAAHNIDAGAAAIVKAGGMPPLWFRVPYGARCPRVDLLLAERGLHHFHWDLDPQEWRPGGAKRTIPYLERELEKMTGRDVLLMHDIKKATVKDLPELLDWIDAENARRQAEHRRPIRIVQSYELAEEELAPGLLAWLAEVAPRPRRLADRIASVLP